MKTFVAVTFGLLPLILFWTLTGNGMPALAVIFGLALCGLIVGWRLWSGTAKSLEIGALVFLALLGIAHLTGWLWATDHAVVASFALLGLFSLAGAALGKPWTAEYSRADYADVADTPEFAAINRVITAGWGVIFLFYAFAEIVSLGLWPIVAASALGSMASLVAPKLITRFMLRRRLGRPEAYDWPLPAIGKMRADAAYDVAIVGAGNGGLTAAALLADAGAKVLVAEQHDVVGGFCHNWRRDIEHAGAKRTFRFDAGVHDVSGTWPGGSIASLLARLGVAGAIEWLPLEHTYRIGSLVVDVPRDWRAYVKQLGALFPESASGIEAFFNDAHAIFDAMYSTAAGNGGIPGPIYSIDELLAFPKRFPVAARWMNRPFAEFLKSHVFDPAARKFVGSLSGYLTDRPDTLTVADMMPIYGYYFNGGAYPKGGSGRLPEVLADVVRRRGGEIRLKAPVKRILVANGKAAGIELTGGERLTAAAVISNADYKRTFLELIEPGQVEPDFRAAVARIEPACSAFRVHLAIDTVPAIRPAQNIIAADGAFLEVVLPSLIDSAAAPAGYATVEMTTLIPHAQARSWFPSMAGADIEAWEHSTAYRARKAALGDWLIGLAEAAIPDLRRHIVLRSDATPVTMARFDWSTDGAIYGVRMSERFHGSKSPLSGLVLAGSVNFGGGTEAVIISGATAADTLLPGLLRGRSEPIEPRHAA